MRDESPQAKSHGSARGRRQQAARRRAQQQANLVHPPFRSKEADSHAPRTTEGMVAVPEARLYRESATVKGMLMRLVRHACEEGGEAQERQDAWGEHQRQSVAAAPSARLVLRSTCQERMLGDRSGAAARSHRRQRGGHALDNLEVKQIAVVGLGGS